MKRTIIFSLIAALIGFGTQVTFAQELAIQDTLILSTRKHKGHGMFGGGFGTLYMEEIPEKDAVLSLIPQEISSPLMGKHFVDTDFLAYYNVKSRSPENLEEFIHTYGIDTANMPSESENRIHLILGMRGQDSVYIVDENGNNDYRDDPVRTLETLIYKEDAPLPEPVMCHYLIYNGEYMVKDSGWVIVAKGSDGRPRISVAQRVVSSFSLQNQEYEIQVMDWIPSASFCFDHPIISITAQNGQEKDSLLYSERLELGEYLQLGDSFYKFDNISNDGKEITLIREGDVSDKVGKQVGFLAPDFSCVTTEGDSISLENFQGKYVLLVNITACWSEPMSYEHYKQLSEQYLSKLDILAIDASKGPLQANIRQLGLKGTFILSPENRAISNHYREDFCSRTCFLINPDGHIVDKFQIHDWQYALAEYFK